MFCRDKNNGERQQSLHLLSDFRYRQKIDNRTMERNRQLDFKCFHLHTTFIYFLFSIVYCSRNFPKKISGGRNRIRTYDLRRVKAAL